MSLPRNLEKSLNIVLILMTLSLAVKFLINSDLWNVFGVLLVGIFALIPIQLLVEYIREDSRNSFKFLPWDARATTPTLGKTFLLGFGAKLLIIYLFLTEIIFAPIKWGW